MKSKTVIITGANSGIGKEASLLFAKEGHTVIMACRNMEKSNTTKSDIISASKNQNVYLMEVDMSSFASIWRFGNKFKDQFPKLDILINNAAYFNHGEEYRLSADNIELTFATNVLGPFLMTYLLLDPLKKSEDARVLNASSNIIKHFFSPNKEIDFINLQGIKDVRYRHSVYTTYRNSKMAFVILTFKMAEEYRQFGIKVNSLQINGARMSRETIKKFKPQWRLIAHIQNLFFPRPEFMAQNYFDICTAEEFQTTSGRLFNHKKELMHAGPENPKFKDIWGTALYPAYADRLDVSEKLWALCISLTKEFLMNKQNP